jgi:hypothetical protein
MKATGKIIGRLIVGCAFACCLSLFTLHSFAIEGLKISIRSTNAVLSWPSTNLETYIVQYRSNLTAASPWLTLTDNLHAASNTNLTVYLHSNGVSRVGGTNRGTGYYQVVRDGVHLFGITNGMILSGEVKIPIEFAVGTTDVIAGVVFYDNSNSPIIGAAAYGAGNYWTLDWNTPMSVNGNYKIYAEIDFATNNPMVSVPVTVTVSNVISFPNYFSRMFGSQMWLFAVTIPNAAYQIDMYDEHTNYFGSFADYADGGGYISFLWDLTDGNGHTFNSTNFYGVFTVDTSSLLIASKTQTISSNTISANSIGFRTFIKKTANGVHPNAGGSSASATQIWAKEPSWSPGNSWAIAYSPLIVNGSPTTLDIEEMMIGGDGGLYGGVVSTLGNYGLGAPMSPGNVSQSSAFQMADANTRSQFLGYLADSQYRHFYFFGHGSPYAFGTHGAVITYSQLDQVLNNFFITAKPANYHPYRLVFIDACNAGKASMCEAFGIPAQTLNNQFFANTHVQSRAFLGFKTTTNFDPSQWTWRALMLGGFFDDWMLGGNTTLQTCVNNAVNAVHSNGFQPLPSSWVIYGATDLTKNTDTTQ